MQYQLIVCFRDLGVGVTTLAEPQNLTWYIPHFGSFRNAKSRHPRVGQFLLPYLCCVSTMSRPCALHVVLALVLKVLVPLPTKLPA